MKRLFAASLCAACVFSQIPVMAAETEPAAGSETEAYVEPAEEVIPEDAIEIGSAEELAAVNENLSGYYLLTADIDLAGTQWTPIGTFAPAGEAEEEQELPDEEKAFTGIFNGNGHTISGLEILGEDGMAVGLFGCAANATIMNLCVDNAKTEGTVMVSDVVGYAYCTTVNDVTLTNSTVTAYASDLSAEGMYGGIVGAGMGSMLINCSAQADITIPDNSANAGIVGGGLESTSLLNCSATGTVTAGNNCYGLGGVSGCGFGAEEFTACEANDVTITAGDGCFWIGGVTGYAGGYEDESFGVPVTAFTDCAARFVQVETGADAEQVGDIVGAGFFNEEVAEAYGAPYDAPTQYTLSSCVVEKCMPLSVRTERESPPCSR